MYAYFNFHYVFIVTTVDYLKSFSDFLDRSPVSDFMKDGGFENLR